MDKNEYFKLCIENKVYRKKAWNLAVFALFEINEEYIRENFNYKLFKSEKGYTFFLDNQYIEIDNTDNTQPLFNLKDEIVIDNNYCLNAEGKIKTTYGRLLFNLLVLSDSFGKKIPYINHKTNIGSIEDIIADRLEDTPPANATRNDKFIYVDEYLKFCNALTFISGLMQLCVWAETPKLMLPPPGVNEYKQKLLEENKDHLDDPTVILNIEKKLIEYDNEFLKGDPGGEYFADSEKSRNIVRKRLFLMYGYKGDENSKDAKPIINSLEQGWDIKNFPQMNDALRAGSYGRGFETQLGGELSKWLLRASSSIQIQPKDCGTHLGTTMIVDERNYKSIIKLYYLDEKFNTIFIESNEVAKSLIGKKIILRTGMYCKAPKTDLCKYCVGEVLSINPNALSSAVADFGSIILQQALAKFHGKEASTNDFTMDLLS